MTFTIEDIKRLIPEAEGFKKLGTFYCFSVHGKQMDSSAGAGLALLTTRRQLEIAMEALREVNASTSSSRLRRVTAEALKSIKKVGEA